MFSHDKTLPTSPIGGLVETPPSIKMKMVFLTVWTVRENRQSFVSVSLQYSLATSCFLHNALHITNNHLMVRYSTFYRKWSVGDLAVTFENVTMLPIMQNAASKSSWKPFMFFFHLLFFVLVVLAHRRLLPCEASGSDSSSWPIISITAADKNRLISSVWCEWYSPPLLWVLHGLTASPKF